MIKKLAMPLILMIAMGFINGCVEAYPPLILNGLKTGIEIDVVLSSGITLHDEMEVGEGFMVGSEESLHLVKLIVSTNSVVLFQLSEADLNSKRTENKEEYWLVEEKSVRSISKKQLIEWNRNNKRQ